MRFSRYYIELALRPIRPGPIPDRGGAAGWNHGTTRASASNMADNLTRRGRAIPQGRLPHPPFSALSTIVICCLPIQIGLLLVKTLALAMKMNWGKRRDADRLSRLLHDDGTCMTNTQLRRYRSRVPTHVRKSFFTDPSRSKSPVMPLMWQLASGQLILECWRSRSTEYRTYWEEGKWRVHFRAADPTKRLLDCSYDCTASSGGVLMPARMLQWRYKDPAWALRFFLLSRLHRRWRKRALVTPPPLNKPQIMWTTWIDTRGLGLGSRWSVQVKDNGIWMMSTSETVGVACLATLSRPSRVWGTNMSGAYSLRFLWACSLPLIVDKNERVGDASHLIQPFDPAALSGPISHHSTSLLTP